MAVPLPLVPLRLVPLRPARLSLALPGPGPLEPAAPARALLAAASSLSTGI